MKTTIKEVFESNNWKITRILQGYHGAVRVDAKHAYDCKFFQDGVQRDMPMN